MTCSICDEERCRLQDSYMREMVDLRGVLNAALLALAEAHTNGEHEEESAQRPMTEQEWLDAGKPHGVQFTITRDVYHKLCKDIESAARIGTNVIALAVETYRGEHSAQYQRTNDSKHYECTYVQDGVIMTLTQQHRDILRAEAAVTIHDKEDKCQSQRANAAQDTE